jgi:signal transduction histidine kinase
MSILGEGSGDMAATAAAATRSRRPASARRAILSLAVIGALGAATIFVIDSISDWDRDLSSRAGFVLLTAGIIMVVTTFAIILVARRFVDRVELPAVRSADDTNVALLEAGLAQIGQGLCIVDSQHRVAIVNRRFAELLGIPAHWLRSGLKFSEAAALIRINLEDETEFQRFWPGDTADDQPRTILHATTDGRLIEIDSRKLPDGGHVITCSDVTARERANEERRDTREQADTAHGVKAEFLANMSHELRTPLNAIIGFTDVMAAEMFGPLGHPNYREYVEDIRSSSRHLLQIITEILQMAKINAGRIELNDEIIDLSVVAHFCRRIVRERVAASNLHLTLEFPPDLPRLRADERLIRQLLLNLLANAVKFTPRDGHITVSGQVDAAGRLVLAVTDTGIGIAAEDIPKVLTPFGQVDNAYTRRQSGTGLGLPIVRSYAELHGAEFEIESAVGAGTCVRIKFPPSRVLGPNATPQQGDGPNENGGP